jgi:DNA primase
MEAKEEIRSRLHIEDVIGQYIQLKRAGRNFKGLSPFTNEKSASFMVSPDKNIWHDFSSNKGGDIFSFVMEVEGIDFRAALEMLARKAGVDLSQYETRGGDRALSQKKEQLYKLLELAVKYYQQSLINNPVALEYVFKKRNLTKTVVQQFGIGYAPNADAGLLTFLLKRGYGEADVRDAGLLTTRRGRPSDMFRGRMMVPLADGQGRVVGFTARLIDDQPNAPKYINTPQTLLYDKGRQVFGLHLAKEAIRKRNYSVVVEGNLDVIASHQAGVAQVVATAGTAMTEYHLHSLSRLSPNVRLAFDRDAAGIAATERAIGIASTLGVQLGIVLMPEGFKDADELVQHDPKAWLAVIEKPQDALEWLLDEYAARYDLATAQGKSQVTSKALEVISQLGDPVAQEHYLQLLAQRVNTSLQAIRAKLDKTSQPVVKQLKATKVAPVSGADQYLNQDRLLALTLGYPAAREVLLQLKPDDFAGRIRQAVFQLLLKLGSRPLTDDLLQRLQSDELRVKIKELQLIVEHTYDQLAAPQEVARERLQIVLKPIKITQRDQMAKALGQATDPQERQSLNDAIKKINQEIKALT